MAGGGNGGRGRWVHASVGLSLDVNNTVGVQPYCMSDNAC
jgi:hypothetical protein